MPRNDQFHGKSVFESLHIIYLNTLLYLKRHIYQAVGPFLYKFATKHSPSAFLEQPKFGEIGLWLHAYFPYNAVLNHIANSIYGNFFSKQTEYKNFNTGVQI